MKLAVFDIGGSAVKYGFWNEETLTQQGQFKTPETFEEMKENYDDVTSILVINQFAPSKLSLEEQSDITERALENYDEFDYIIANDELAKTKEKVFKILEGLENEN